MNPIQSSLTFCLPLLSPILYCIISIHLLPHCHFFCFHSPSPLQSFPTMWVLVLASLLLLYRRHLPSCPLYFILFQPMYYDNSSLYTEFKGCIPSKKIKSFESFRVPEHEGHLPNSL